VAENRSVRGRRERAKRDKQARIMAAARDLFSERGVTAVTTQEIADRADVAIGTLYLYAATKAELLIMVQNQKFADAIADGIAAAATRSGTGVVDGVMALVHPVVTCVRDRVENGRTYLRELVFGDPAEPYRRAGLALSAQLEDAIAEVVRREADPAQETAATLARVVTAIIHIATTATVYLERTDTEVLDDISTQVTAVLMGPTQDT
jgi:AcrR family transcriptional regulator